MNRLTQQKKWTDDIDLSQEMGYKHIFQRLAEYENAEEQGLLVRLPCKVGDTVYTIYDNGDDKPQIETRKVFEVSTARIWLDSDRYCFSYDYFSKTAFLTKEDAEKALAERKLKMTREILFRGFHEDENGSTAIYVDDRAVKGEWVYGYYWLNETATRQTAHITNADGDMYVVIPSTVGQYTGLYSKEEKRIFEGDKCIVTMFNYEGSDSQYSCKIDYDEGCFFAGNDTDVCIPLQEIGDTQTDITVTGTIFDKEGA